MIFVGTSGYSFRDWVGPFYPAGTRNPAMLAHYARVFPAVEINATYYRLPSASTFQGMVKNTPAGLRFVVKLSGTLTHGDRPSARAGRKSRGRGDSRADASSRTEGPPQKEEASQTSLFREEPAARDLPREIPAGSVPDPDAGSGRPGSLPESESVAEGCRAFLQAIAPLEDAGRLDGILAQFPYRFREGQAGRERIEELRHHLGPRPLFVEFRHQSWNRESTYEHLRNLDVGFCTVDEPALPGLFPPVVRQTTDVAYFRFHGRNAERWWDGDNSTRYDYLYSDDELREWAVKIHDTSARTRQTFVFFNNCHGGSAPRNAEQMQAILGQLHGEGD